MAEVIVDFFLGFSECELHLADQKRVLQLEVDQDIASAFIEFILDSDDFEVVSIVFELFIDPENLFLAANAFASQQVHHPKADHVYLRFKLSLAIAVLYGVQLL